MVSSFLSLSFSAREKENCVHVKNSYPVFTYLLELRPTPFFFKYIWKGICSHRGQCQGPVQWTFVFLSYVSIFLLTHLCYYFFRCNNIQTIIENPLIWHVWWWLMIIPIWRRNSLSQCITRRLLNTREIESLHNSLRSRGGSPPKGRDSSHYHKLVFFFLPLSKFPRLHVKENTKQVKVSSLNFSGIRCPQHKMPPLLFICSVNCRFEGIPSTGCPCTWWVLWVTSSDDRTDLITLATK